MTQPKIWISKPRGKPQYWEQLERLHLQDPQQTTKKFVSGGRQEFRSA
jgi:hypothetical protein